MDEVLQSEPLRTVISWTAAICLGVAMAPWFSGGQDTLGALLSGFALFLGSLMIWKQPAVRRLKTGPLVIMYGALVAWTGLSLIWTVNRYSTEVWLIGLVLAGLAFRLAYAIAGEAAGRRRLLMVYLGSAVMAAGYGLFLYLTSGYDRLTSSFYWPNPAAAYFIPALIVAFDEWRRDGKWWWGALSVLFGTTFVLTQSRAAGLVLIVILVVYSLCIRLKKRFWILLVFTVSVSFGFSYGLTFGRHIIQPKAVITTPGSRLAPASSNGVQSGSDRLHYLESVFLIWSHHPILGTGAGTFADVHPKYQLRVISASTSAHDVYLQTLSELGIIGFALLLWVMVILGVGAVRGLINVPKQLALAIGIGGLWLHFGLDIDAQYPALVLLASIFTGSLYYQKPTYAGLSWRMPIIGLLILAPITILYLSDTWAARGLSTELNDYDYTLGGQLLAKAHSLGIYNPDVLSADGINHYTLATANGPKELSTALTLARHAEQSDPSDGQHHQLEGRILEAQGKNAAAEAAFRQALVLDPYNHPDYAYDLVYLLIEEKKIDQAKAVASSMLEQYPPSVVANRAADPTVATNLSDLQVVIGSFKLQAGDLKGAREDSKRALALDPSDVRAQALSSVLLHEPTTP